MDKMKLERFEKNMIKLLSDLPDAISSGRIGSRVVG